MNELHDYPPYWDDPNITELPEFEGLLTKNVEALFLSSGINNDFLVKLGEVQPDSLGTDVITALLSLLKETNSERITRDIDYAILIAEKMAELRIEMQDVARQHVFEDTKQELIEQIREDVFERKLKASGF